MIVAFYYNVPAVPDESGYIARVAVLENPALVHEVIDSPDEIFRTGPPAECTIKNGQMAACFDSKLSLACSHALAQLPSDYPSGVQPCLFPYFRLVGLIETPAARRKILTGQPGNGFSIP